MANGSFATLFAAPALVVAGYTTASLRCALLSDALLRGLRPCPQEVPRDRLHESKRLRSCCPETRACVSARPADVGLTKVGKSEHPRAKPSRLCNEQTNREASPPEKTATKLATANMVRARARSTRGRKGPSTYVAWHKRTARLAMEGSSQVSENQEKQEQTHACSGSSIGATTTLSVPNHPKVEAVARQRRSVWVRIRRGRAHRAGCRASLTPPCATQALRCERHGIRGYAPLWKKTRPKSHVIADLLLEVVGFWPGNHSSSQASPPSQSHSRYFKNCSLFNLKTAAVHARLSARPARTIVHRWENVPLELFTIHRADAVSNYFVYVDPPKVVTACARARASNGAGFNASM